MTTSNTQAMPARSSRLTTEQVSELTGVPVATLRYWRSRGDKGPPSWRIGKRVVYDLAGTESWLEAEKARTLRGGVA